MYARRRRYPIGLDLDTGGALWCGQYMCVCVLEANSWVTLNMFLHSDREHDRSIDTATICRCFCLSVWDFRVDTVSRAIMICMEFLHNNPLSSGTITWSDDRSRWRRRRRRCDGGDRLGVGNNENAACDWPFIDQRFRRTHHESESGIWVLAPIPYSLFCPLDWHVRVYVWMWGWVWARDLPKNPIKISRYFIHIDWMATTNSEINVSITVFRHDLATRSMTSILRARQWQQPVQKR